MIAFLAILATLALVMVVPMIATSVARNVGRAMQREQSGSIDQELIEARLGRIEEAIDAMALQIERLSDQQRTLPGSPAAAAPVEGERQRSEPSR